MNAPRKSAAGGRGALVLEGVSKTYGTFTALRPTDLTVPEREFLAVLGPSGSGKTTLLRLVGGFAAPTTGRVLLDGEDITARAIFDRPCNTVFQDYALFPHMRVRKNVGYGLSVRGHPRSEIAGKVDRILATVGLEEFADRYPAQLSGGQRQRVALARAMICEPRLILLDEPLAALDAEMRQQMQEFLKAIQRQLSITFLFVTHDQSEAIAVADRIAVMSEGRIEQIATPTDLYYRPRTRFVAGFFGENNLIPGTVARSGTQAVARTAVGAFPAGEDAPPDGADCIVAVRPETITLETDGGGPAGAGTAATLTAPGTITDILFNGAQTRVKVAPRDTDGPGIVCLVPSQRADSPFSMGAPVTMFFPADCAIVAA